MIMNFDLVNPLLSTSFNIILIDDLLSEIINFLGMIIERVAFIKQHGGKVDDELKNIGWQPPLDD